METCHVLNPDNDVHIFCLHYVFTPRINRDLDSFVAAWNRHGISSAGNQTPLQLWMMGMNSVAYSDLLVAQEIFDENSTYGIDWDGPSPQEEWDGPLDGVDVPSIPCPLQEVDLQRLKISINPLAESDCYGSDIYLRVLSFVNNCLLA